MALDQRRLLLFGGAALLRILLFVLVPSLPDLLTGRAELSTPVTNFKRLQEGVFLYTHNVSPYDGGAFHEAPLILPLVASLPSTWAFSFTMKMLYIVVDLFSANALMRIADSGEAGSSRLFTSPRKDMRLSSLSVGAAYLFNPFTIAICMARSTSVFTNCAILYALDRAVLGRTLTSAFALSMASYMSLYPILLLPPLALVCFDRQHSPKPSRRPLSFGIFYATSVAVIIAGLLLLSYFITGCSWEFLSSTYGFHLLIPDLTPNVGLWWYFFIEMFDSFRAFFIGVFWLHLASYVAGLSIRIRRQPLFVATTLIGLFAIFKPYPSISDTALYLGLLPLYRHVFPLMRYSFFAVSALLYATLLGPAFHYLWIYAGSGNANFFYAITLVWSLGLSVIVADSIFAVARDEWEVERPEMRGKLIRHI